MKRFLFIFLSFFLALGFASCGKKIEYTKEFSYLPTYPGMELAKKITTNQQGFTTAIYKVKGEASKVIEEYQITLHDDGWKTTEDKKPISITVEKDNHVAVIVPSQEKDNTKLFIYSK